MTRLIRIAAAIDRMNEWIGRRLYWLTLGMIILGGFNAIVRYLDKFTGLGLSSNTYLELQWYFFSLIFLLGAAYTLKHDAHVRVDVLYSKLGLRGQAIVNLAGVCVFLIPFCLVMIGTSWPAVHNSWEVLEMSPDPGGLPRYPIKTVIPIAFGLILLQGLSMAIRQVAVLIGFDDAESDKDVGAA